MKFLPKGEAQRRRCTKRAECLPTARRDEFQFLPNLLAARRYHLVDENARLCCTLEPMESIYRVLLLRHVRASFRLRMGNASAAFVCPLIPLVFWSTRQRQMRKFAGEEEVFRARPTLGRK